MADVVLKHQQKLEDALTGILNAMANACRRAEGANPGWQGDCGEATFSCCVLWDPNGVPYAEVDVSKAELVTQIPISLHRIPGFEPPEKKP